MKSKISNTKILIFVAVLYSFTLTLFVNVKADTQKQTKHKFDSSELSTREGISHCK